MDLRSLARNTSIAFLAQGIAMGVSVLTTLLVPKLLGVAQYGYWQLFIFYSTYVGFCHLGLNDGVYLENGGVRRDRIDKRSVNSQFLVGIVFQAVLASVVLLGVWASGLGPERSFVLGVVALYMVVKNAASYLGYAFQAMNETVLYSLSCIIERLSFLVPLAALLLLRVRTFEGYAIAYLTASVVQLLYCLWHARDFLRSGLLTPAEALHESVGSVRIGIKLMFANIASQLVLGIARFAIDAAWGIETFGKLSLSLSLVNFFLSFVSQAAMVLFPALREGGEDDQRRFYRVARDGMSLLFPAVYLLYFPLSWLLTLWLPEYAESVRFFIYLLPICVFDSRMSISCTTLFKVRREEGTLFAINVATTFVSAVGTLVGVVVFRSVYVVIAAVTIAIVARSTFSELLLSKRIGIGSGAVLTVGELAVTAVFITAASSFVIFVAVLVSVAAYAIYLLANKNRVLSFVGKINIVRDK